MRRIFIIIAAGALFACGFLVARFNTVLPTAFAQETQQFPIEKMREFAEIFQIVKNYYVDEISDEKLMDNAIQGLISGLDPHSAYLPAESLSDFEDSIQAEQYGGVGIYIGQKDGWVEVISPIDETPAAKAGLLPGDLILKIDGTSTQGMSIDDAVKLMRGTIGDIVVLEILHIGDNQTRTVELSRAQIVAPTAVAALVEPDYGYLRLNRFQRETVADAVKNLNKLYDENERPLRGLILDLRNNPGGLLETSIGIASIFLPAGVTVVSDRSRNDENSLISEARYYSGLNNEEAVKKLRIVVLVNNGSASASEIVAGALQDHRRAVIIGIRTYGKASVQSLLRLPSTEQKTGLKLTTARYFTPDARSIQAVGIKPDIEVFAGDSIAKPEDGFVLREKDLARHLENPQAEEETDTDVDAVPFVPRNDYQYDQALVVLKALTVAGH